MRNYTICIYTPKVLAWAKARPSQAWLLAFGPTHNFLKPKLPKARPKPGLSGQAQASTSLIRTEADIGPNMEHAWYGMCCHHQGWWSGRKGNLGNLLMAKSGSHGKLIHKFRNSVPFSLWFKSDATNKIYRTISWKYEPKLTIEGLFLSGWTKFHRYNFKSFVNCEHTLFPSSCHGIIHLLLLGFSIGIQFITHATPSYLVYSADPSPQIVLFDNHALPFGETIDFDAELVGRHFRSPWWSLISWF